jgi:hypothetical protein
MIRCERLEHGHFRICDRVGVVVAVDLTDVRLAALEVELLDLIQRALDEVDRFLMQRRRAAREARFTDHVGAVRRVHHNEVVRRDRPQAD